MNEYLIQDSTLTDIADAIREKTGDSALMTPAEMVEAIAGIETGGGGATSFTFNPARTVSNNNAPACLQSILDAVQPVIGDVPFYMAWIDGDKPNNYATTLLYIPVGWKCGGNALTAVYAYGTRNGLPTITFNIAGTGYYLNISTNSLYRCVSLADCFVKEE